MTRLRGLFERYPASPLWALIVGYNFFLIDMAVAFIPHGPVREGLLVFASLVTLVPGLIIWRNVAGAAQVLIEELRRRGYNGLLVRTRTARSYWQSAGFGLVLLGLAALYGGLTS